jgi:hypothetical protein
MNNMNNPATPISSFFQKGNIKAVVKETINKDKAYLYIKGWFLHNSKNIAKKNNLFETNSLK